MLFYVRCCYFTLQLLQITIFTIITKLPFKFNTARSRIYYNFQNYAAGRQIAADFNHDKR